MRMRSRRAILRIVSAKREARAARGRERGRELEEQERASIEIADRDCYERRCVAEAVCPDCGRNTSVIFCAIDWTVVCEYCGFSLTLPHYVSVGDSTPLSAEQYFQNKRDR